MGGFTCLTLLPSQRRAWYWSALVRAEGRLVCLVDLDVRIPPRSLEIRADGLWADHICEERLEHWTIGNEAFGIALDDPGDALGRALGDPTPLGFDLEWEASSAPTPMTGSMGYVVDATVHGEVLIGSESLNIDVTGCWWHRWGNFDWIALSAGLRPEGLRAPVALEIDGQRRALELILRQDGWVSWTGDL